MNYNWWSRPKVRRIDNSLSVIFSNWLKLFYLFDRFVLFSFRLPTRFLPFIARVFAVVINSVPAAGFSDLFPVPFPVFLLKKRLRYECYHKGWDFDALCIFVLKLTVVMVVLSQIRFEYFCMRITEMILQFLKMLPFLGHFS